MGGAQARGLDVLLRHKVERWALRSNALALEKCEDGHAPEYKRWSEVLAGRSKEAVKWATIKPADRAIQKILHSYKGNVSRLLDICRQRMVFETVQDLNVGLRRILQDEDVVICRVRNYLDVSHQVLPNPCSACICVRHAANRRGVLLGCNAAEHTLDTLCVGS